MLEVAKSLMFTMQVAEALWGDLLLSSAYIIDRRPFKALDLETPLEIL